MTYTQLFIRFLKHHNIYHLFIYNIKNRGNISNCCRGKYNYCGKLPDGTKLVWRYLVWNHNKKFRIK